MKNVSEMRVGFIKSAFRILQEVFQRCFEFVFESGTAIFEVRRGRCGYPERTRGSADAEQRLRQGNGLFRNSREITTERE